MALVVTEMHDVEARQYLPGCFQDTKVSIISDRRQGFEKHTKPSCADPRRVPLLVLGLARRLPLLSPLPRSVKRLHGPKVLS